MPANPLPTFLALCVLLPGAVQAAPIDDFVALVARRNAIAQDVAAFKYPAGRPVDDPAREAQVLQDKHARAVDLGLDPDRVVHFYRQAMDANKLIQYVAFHRYAAGQVPPRAPPLDALRRAIDRVDTQLLALWPRLEPVRGTATCGARLADAVDQSTPSVLQHTALVRALVGFCSLDGSGEADAQRAGASPRGG